MQLVITRQIGWCLKSDDKSFMFIATIIFLKFSLFHSTKSKQFEFVRPDMFVVTVVKNMPCYTVGIEPASFGMLAECTAAGHIFVDHWAGIPKVVRLQPW